MSRQILTLLAAAPLVALTAADDGRFEHKDWQLVCENNGTCRAAGYQKADDKRPISIRITRETGADAVVNARLAITYHLWKDKPALPSSGELFLDGTSLGTLTLKKSGHATYADLDPTQTAAVLDAVIHTGNITFTADGNTWALSGAGATATLLKMDEYQQRTGTPSALVKRGDSNAPVRQAKNHPVIQAAAVASDPGRTVAPNDPDYPALHALLLSKADAGCNVLRESQQPITLYPLDNKHTLAETACWQGAYNRNNYYAVLNAEQNRVLNTVPISDIPDDNGRDSGAGPIAYKDGVITAFARESEEGDCVVNSRYVWNGKTFAYSYRSESNLCRGFPGNAWKLPSFAAAVKKPASAGESGQSAATPAAQDNKNIPPAVTIRASSEPAAPVTDNTTSAPTPAAKTDNNTPPPAKTQPAATGKPLPLAANLPASADGALAYLGTETTTTAPLILTLDPGGGATVAVIPRGGKTTVLLTDGAGHYLVKNHFGLTGWALASESSKNDDFPTLATHEQPIPDSEARYTLHYLANLGSTMQDDYHRDQNGVLNKGTPPAGVEKNSHYRHLLDTRLKTGGPRYHILCLNEPSDSPYCYLAQAADGWEKETLPALHATTYYLPGNGYLYTANDDPGHYRKRQKWQLNGSTLQEETQPYYALDLASTYRGLGQNQDAPLELHDADGKRVATLAPGDSVTLLLADGQYNCPADARASDNRCHENRLLLKTADNTLGWVTVNDKQDKAPKFDGLTPSAD